MLAAVFVSFFSYDCMAMTRIITTVGEIESIFTKIPSSYWGRTESMMHRCGWLGLASTRVLAAVRERSRSNGRQQVMASGDGPTSRRLESGGDKEVQVRPGDHFE